MLAHDWVLEFDIKGLFDNIDHELLMRAVKKHVKIPCIKTLHREMAESTLSEPNGRVEERSKERHREG